MRKDSEWQFVVGNDQRALLDALCEECFFSDLGPFEKRLVVVPNASLKDVVLRHLVEDPRLRIAAGVQVLPLGQAVTELLDQCVPSDFCKKIPSFVALSLAIEEVLQSSLVCGREFLPLSNYLQVEDQGQGQRRRAQLSDALARCFLRYGLYGQEFLPVWVQREGWQQRVWNAIFSKDSPWTFPLECLSAETGHFPGKIALFGFSYLSPAHLSFFSQISVTLYHLSPCALFWGDFASDRQRLSTRRFFERKGGGTKALEELDQLMRASHPLLGNWGRLGREMLKSLEAFSLNEIEVYREGSSTSLLCRLQASLLTLDESEELFGDDSIQLHTAPSKLREVEVLCDGLRTLLHSRKVCLRDVLIACPRIEEYLPYIHLVFAKSEFAYAIEGIPLLHLSAAVRRWMQLLELPQMDYVLDAVLKVLNHPSLMKKWGFSKGEVVTLGLWFKEAQIRQGLTGHPNSWKEGIDRLLQGLVFAPGVDVVAQSEIDLLNRFLIFFLGLQRDLALLSGSKTVPGWLEFFLRLAQDYFLIEWDKEPFFQELRALALSCAHLKNGEWSFESMARILRHVGEKLAGSRGAATQEKIAFVPLVQGYLRSAKILWCLGMDEEAFPRLEMPSSLCEMRKFQGRDYCPSPGEEDSAVFLEALLHAKDFFIFSYQRVHSDDGKPQGPSSLVDTLNQYIVNRGVTCGIVRMDHPAFPLDSLYFSAESKIKKWSEAEFCAAQARYFSLSAPAPFLHFNAFSSRTQGEITIDIRQLKKLARSPLQFYFNETLKIYLGEEEDREGEEFLLSGLQKAMLRKHMAHTPAEQVMCQLGAQGKLPRGLFQHVAAREVEAEREVFLKQLDRWEVTAEEIRAVRLSPGGLMVPLGDSMLVHIVGMLDGVSPQGLLAHVDNDLKGLVKVWPLYLIYRCIDPKHAHLLLTKKGLKMQIALEDPRAALASYLDYFLLALERPSVLMPQFAKAIFEGGEEELTSALSKESQDPYLNYLKRHRSSFEPKEALTLWKGPLEKAFAPLMRGRGDGI
jgi:exodeoxyribonuclease V gamma subunit